MGPRSLPTVSGQQAVRALLRLGFKLDRVRGSHHVLRHDGPPLRAVTVPVHGNKNLPKGTLQAIVKKSGFTAEDFAAQL